MNFTFKQFTSYLSEAEGKSEDQLQEIWSKIFGKKKEEEDEKEKEEEKKGGPMTAKDLERKRKELADKRKEDLKKKRDEEWQKAKDRIEAGRSGTSTRGDRHADTAWRGGIKEAKTAYSDYGYWKDDAAEKGYKVKKLSGNLEDGDQTWGAFDGDKKVGSFTEEEEGRGGWLVEAKKEVVRDYYGKPLRGLKKEIAVDAKKRDKDFKDYDIKDDMIGVAKKPD